MQKGNTVIIICLGIIVLLVGALMVTGKFAAVRDIRDGVGSIAPVPNPNPKPTPQPNPTPEPKNLVSFGQQFTAHKGDIFTIKNGITNLSFQITGFYYHPCPTGAQCIWSGLDVFYRITVCPSNPMMGMPCRMYEKKEPLAKPAGMPYEVQIKDSDYKTYAKVIITNPSASYPTTGQ